MPNEVLERNADIIIWTTGISQKIDVSSVLNTFYPSIKRRKMDAESNELADLSLDIQILNPVIWS